MAEDKPIGDELDLLLLPCPFCGTAAGIHVSGASDHAVRVWCATPACGASAGGSSAKEAIAAWNTRSDSAAAIAMREAASRVGLDHWGCDAADAMADEILRLRAGLAQANRKEKP